MQVSGRGARGRKQSRYHPRWREVRDENKYERMMVFGAALPAIRERLEHDLSAPGTLREKVLAVKKCIREESVESPYALRREETNLQRLLQKRLASAAA